MDNSPPHSLIVVVVGVVEVRHDPSQVLEGRMQRDRYLHSLVNNRDSLVGHVVVLIFEGIVHKRMVDGLWLMDLSWHKFSVIIVVESASLVSVVLNFTQN
jgi:signal-transduction protein with cAMP-binding, CBS, and nucleotidyltransferase domain